MRRDTAGGRSTGPGEANARLGGESLDDQSQGTGATTERRSRLEKICRAGSSAEWRRDRSRKIEQGASRAADKTVRGKEGWDDQEDGRQIDRPRCGPSRG